MCMKRTETWPCWLLSCCGEGAAAVWGVDGVDFSCPVCESKCSVNSSSGSEGVGPGAELKLNAVH